MSRIHAVLTALAFVVSSLFGLIHEATTTHVRCAQHGELIDGDPAIADAVSLSRSEHRPVEASSPDPEPSAAMRGLSTIAVHGHEHCSVLSATRQSRVVPRSPAIGPALIAIDDLAIAAPRATTARGDVLYRTAPKTSPPA